MRGLSNIQLNHVLGALALAWVLVSGAAAAEPELTVIPQEGSVHPNRAYRIVCEVSWVGSPLDYAILPAEADPIDWGTAKVSHVRAYVRSDADGARNIVSQTLEITPNKTGEFQTPEIRISYLTPEATSPAENSAAPKAAAPGTVPPDSGASPSLRADPFSIVVQPDRTLIWVFGGLGASLLLTALGWRFARHSRKPQPTLSPKPADLPAIQGGLHRARQLRLDGNFYEYYLELARTVNGLPTERKPAGLAEALEGRAQAVGYQGVRPTDDEMDGNFRDVERALTRYKESVSL
jgi:hypothetical protein